MRFLVKKSLVIFVYRLTRAVTTMGMEGGLRAPRYWFNHDMRPSVNALNLRSFTFYIYYVLEWSGWVCRMIK